MAKTTVTHLAKELLEGSSKIVGLIGTTGYYVGSEHFPTSHTTPGPVALQSMLNKMVNVGAESVVLEVSSHALAMERVKGCEFDIVVLPT